MNTTIKKRIEEINSGRVPEGYEKTSFGIFPCDWEKVSLGEVSAKKGEYGLNAPACEYKEGLPKYLRITDIDDQGRYIDNNACVNDADSRKYVLNKGDIVFARTGASVGKNYIYDEKDGILVYAGFLIKFSIKPQYNAYLICSNCRTKKYDNWVAKMCARSGQPGINAEEYATYSFIIPKSAQEQSRIAEILTQWDKAIELQEKLIKSYQKLKKYYLSKMFPKKGSPYPEIRFEGFTEPWEQRKLSELIIEYKETVDSNCTLPVLTSSKTDGVILQEEHFGRVQNHDITGYNILPRNYCTYRNRSDGVDFTFNINRCCDMGIISKFYPVFYGNNSDIFFLSMVLNFSDEVVHEIAYTCTGTGQKVLSFLDLQKMNIRVPSYDEQKKISVYFETIDNLITLHQSELDKLIKQRKALQQYLLTGMVRV